MWNQKVFFTALVGGWLCLAGGASGEVLFDFEQGNIGEAWQAAGKVKAEKVDVPEKMGVEGPKGKGLRIEAQAGAVAASRKGKIPEDWRGFDRLTMWVHRSEEEGKRNKGATVEVQLVEEDGKTRFWRKVVVEHVGWKELELDLKWFRRGAGRLPRWNRMARVQLFFRDPAVVTVDGIAVRKSAAGPWPGVEDLRKLGFPESDPKSVRMVDQPHLRLLTDAEDLDLEKLTGHLAQVRQAMLKEWPMLAEAEPPPCLLVFRTEAAYRAFTPRFAEQLSGAARPPTSGGFTVEGIATSYWDPAQGTLRPVFTHEYIHSLLERSADLPNLGEWLQEGLATRYQLRFHPQAGLDKLILDGLGDSDRRLPLTRLANGQPIPFNRYWQAHSFLELLLDDPQYQGVPAKLLVAMQKQGSTDVAPHLGALLPKESELESDWTAFARKKYTE